MYSKPGIQRTRLPKPVKHVRSALEHRHERDIAASAQGRQGTTERFISIMGSGLQTEVQHANGVILVRTYDDGESELFEQTKVR